MGFSHPSNLSEYVNHYPFVANSSNYFLEELKGYNTVLNVLPRFLHIKQRTRLRNIFNPCAKAEAILSWPFGLVLNEALLLENVFHLK